MADQDEGSRSGDSPGEDSPAARPGPVAEVPPAGLPAPDRPAGQPDFLAEVPQSSWGPDRPSDESQAVAQLPEPDSAAEEPQVVAELPKSEWTPVDQPGLASCTVRARLDDWTNEGHGAPNLPLPPAAEQPRRNSPLAIVAVLGLVIVIVLAMGAPGQFTTEVAGTPVPGPTVDTKPNAVAPPTSSTKAPTSSTSSRPRWQELTDGNSLLTPGMQLPQVTCKLPGFGRSAEQLRAYYQAMIGCLDEAWKPLLVQSDHGFGSPNLNVDDNPASGCGTPTRQEAVAFYCPRDKTIFMPRNRVTESIGSNQGGHIMVMAHEYGHHVQAMSNINYGMGLRMAGLDEDSPEYLELTRRMELQADCFSGMFITAAGGKGSISKSLSSAASSAFRNSVADKTHGTVKHQMQWGTAGVKNNNTNACNTWLAPAGEVS